MVTHHGKKEEEVKTEERVVGGWRDYPDRWQTEREEEKGKKINKLRERGGEGQGGGAEWRGLRQIRNEASE